VRTQVRAGCRGLPSGDRCCCDRAVLVVEVVVEHVGGLGFVAGQEVAVAVERDGDRAVAHVAAERFGVDAGGDRVGGVAVAAFVQADRDEPRGLPGGTN
jgi:hypothetical protein